jgi:hypothetical protein
MGKKWSGASEKRLVESQWQDLYLCPDLGYAREVSAVRRVCSLNNSWTSAECRLGWTWARVIRCWDSPETPPEFRTSSCSKRLPGPWDMGHGTLDSWALCLKSCESQNTIWFLNVSEGSQPVTQNRMVSNMTGSAIPGTWNLEAQKPWFGDHQRQRSHTPLIFVSHKVKESCSCNVLKGPQTIIKHNCHNWAIGQKLSPWVS